MGFVIGIDEVGRGSLAGPVVVCAALVPRALSLVTRHTSLRLRDSKQLTRNQREKWFAHLTAHPKIRFALAKVYPKTIDRINISQAANLAAFRAFHRLTKSSKLKAHSYSVYLDGGLYLGNNRLGRSLSFPPALTRRGRRRRDSRFTLDPRVKPEDDNQKYFAKTIVRADETIPAVSIASIIAKVTRDRLMVRLAKKHPHYGFEVHKGYGTLRHRRAIKKHGPRKAHRLTFLDFLKNSKPKRRNFSRKS